jgi:hypothetical protein
MSRNEYIACEICFFFYELTEQEIKRHKELGLNTWEWWCHWDPNMIVTLPESFCYRFRCRACGGDLEDKGSHFDCLEIEFEPE